MGVCVGDIGSVTGCSVVTGASAWSKLGRGENAASAAFGFAGSLVDNGRWNVWLAQPVNSVKYKAVVNIRAIIVIPLCKRWRQYNSEYRNPFEQNCNRCACPLIRLHLFKYVIVKVEHNNLPNRFCLSIPLSRSSIRSNRMILIINASAARVIKLSI